MDPQTPPPAGPVTPPVDPTAELNAAASRKRIMILAGGLFVVIIVAAIIFLMRGGNAPNQGGGGGGAAGGGAGSGSGGGAAGGPTAGGGGGGTPLPGRPTQIPTISDKLPDEVALVFYNWYVNHPNPLESGDYEVRSDITSEYKGVMGRYVARGLPKDSDPVFSCGQFPLPRDVSAYPAELDLNETVALVTLYQGKSEQGLYQVKLVKSGGNWLVRDVWCAP